MASTEPADVMSGGRRSPDDDTLTFTLADRILVGLLAVGVLAVVALVAAAVVLGLQSPLEWGIGVFAVLVAVSAVIMVFGGARKRPAARHGGEPRRPTLRLPALGRKRRQEPAAGTGSRADTEPEPPPPPPRLPPPPVPVGGPPPARRDGVPLQPVRPQRPGPPMAGDLQNDLARGSAVAVDAPRALPYVMPVASFVIEGGSSAGRALWRLPDRSGQPGIAVDAARVGDVDVRAASVIGPSHRCSDPPVVRQDAYGLAPDTRRRHLVIAVADGLGSSEHSDVGARVAVSTAVREVVSALDGGVPPGDLDARALFATVSQEIVGTGRSRGHDDRDVCCLLVVAVVPTAPGPDGFRQVWTAQVGDVSVWSYGERWHQETGLLKTGLDRNHVDAVLPFHPDDVRTDLLTVPPGHRIAVVTDGVGDFLTDVGPAGGFFEEQWASPPHPAKFLMGLCADAPGQDDDRTAVVVWCGAADGPAQRDLR